MCHCGSKLKFEECCQPLISGKKVAETPEALMRSRYSAFCVKDLDYIRKTTDPQAKIDWQANREWAEQSEFTSLEILNTSVEGNKGTVEFKAVYTIKTEPEPVIHHELSKFRKQAGVWYFRDGKTVAKPAGSAT